MSAAPLEKQVLSLVGKVGHKAADCSDCRKLVLAAAELVQAKFKPLVRIGHYIDKMRMTPKMRRQLHAALEEVCDGD